MYQNLMNLSVIINSYHQLFYILILPWLLWKPCQAALTLSSSVSLVDWMSWVSSSDIFSVACFCISSSRAFNYSTKDVFNIKTVFLLTETFGLYLFIFSWPVCCDPAARPHDPASRLCFQHLPAGHPHPTHCPCMLGSGQAASRSLFASSSAQEIYIRYYIS